jgi:glucose/arabinose dehydrogenase
MRNFYPVLWRGLLLSLCFFFQSVNSQPLLGFTSPVSGFTNPVDLVAEPGSNRFFVVEQGGLIRILDGTTILPTAFLTINGSTPGGFTSGGERGLLSMAFHPGYTNPANRYFFIYYNNGAGDITIARYRRDAGDADIAETAGVVLLTIPKSFDNHNGGKLNFGADGNLYFATGDGGDSNDPEENAQDGNSLLGKMLRLNVDDFATPPFYTIPPDNPFVGGSPIDDRIFALGLRNPWRWSFDTNGDIWIADVGQGNWEEVNRVTGAEAGAGLNYGWRCREGQHDNPNIAPCVPSGGTTEEPIFEYTHNMATGGFSITGGYVYRGSDPSNASLVGYYVCADYVSGNVWTVLPDGSSNRQTALRSNISGFGVANNGELYAVTRGGGGTGNVSRVVVTGVLPVRLVQFGGNNFPGRNELNWKTAFEENADKFVVEYSTNGTDYSVAGIVPSSRNPNGSFYTFNHYITNNGLIRYRLRMEDIDLSRSYSPIISLSNRSSQGIRIYPSIITDNLLHVIAGPTIEGIDIFTMNGKQVYTKAMNGISGYFNLPLPSLQKGMYLVRLKGKDFQATEKIFIQ